MKIKIKKVFVSALVFAITLITLAVCANAEEAANGYYKYRLLIDGTAEITKYTGSSEAIEIPSEIDGHKVTVIGYNAFTENTALKSLIIPNGVTTIEDGYETLDVNSYGAFSGCTSLVSVSIPESVTTIGAYAFKDCGLLTDISLSSGLLSIGKGAFDSCKSLNAIAIPDSVARIGENAFKDTSLLNEKDVQYIDDWLICCDKGVEQLDVREGTKGIAGYAFKSCNSLTDITLPDSVQHIGEGAFYGCASLKSIEIPSKVTTIERVTFIDCSALSDVTIPMGVKKIDISAFTKCSSLSCMILPESVTEIYDNVFYKCNSLKSVYIPKNVERIIFDAFRDCPSLTAVYCEQEENSLGYSPSVFLNTKNSMATIYYNCKPVLKDGFELIERNNELTVTLFNSKETTAVIPEELDGMPVTKIESTVFNCNTDIEVLYIPKSIKEFSASSFSDCIALKKIFYAGTQSEWNEIVKNSTQTFSASADICYNSEFANTSEKTNGADTQILISLIAISIVMLCGGVLLIYCIKKRESR